jgi:signal transduction histidine kinase
MFWRGQSSPSSSSIASYLDVLPLGLLIFDQHGQVTHLNPTLRQWLPQIRFDPKGTALAEALHAYPDFANLPVGQHEVRSAGRTFAVEVVSLGQGQGGMMSWQDISLTKSLQAAHEEEEAFSQALRHTADLLNSSLEPDQVLQQMLQAVKLVVPHDFANIMLIDDERQTARILYHQGYPEALAQAQFKKPLSLQEASSLYQLMTSNTPLLVPDTARYSQWQLKSIVYLVRSYVGVPIRFDDQVIGFLNLDSQTPDSFTPLQAERLMVFANQAAIALRNARLYDQARQQKEALDQQVDFLSVVLGVYREMNESRSVDYLLSLTLDTAIRLSNAEAGFVALAQQDGRFQVKQRYGDYMRYMEAEAFLHHKLGAISRVMQTKRPELILDVLSDPDYTPHLPHTKAQMTIPLLSGARLIGLIHLESAHPAYLSEEVFSLMQIVAGRIAVALENAALRESLQAQLETQQRLYEQVSNLAQIKSDMIRIAAHDLGNPLGVIRGFLELLLDEPDRLDESQLDALKKVDRNAERMQQIIKDILSLERIERMGQGNTAYQMDLRSQVEQAYREFLPLAREKGQQLLLQIKAGYSYPIIADNVQLYEAITNLVNNAIKYTPAGGHITLYLSPYDTDQIEFKVEDTGYGIPQELQARLFQPFYRAQTPQTKDISGTGLGLHLVKNIVERQAGKLFFLSAEGQGSTFGFRMQRSPVAKPDSPLDESTEATQPISHN